MIEKLSLFMFLVVVLVSCSRDSENSKNDNICFFQKDQTKSSSVISCSLKVGHDAKDCNNSCLVVNGHRIHIDCQGAVRKCIVRVSLQLETISDNHYTATTIDTLELTDQDVFNMPARSMCVEPDVNGKSIWLNIPAQLVIRDSVTRQFTLTGLNYTNYKYYNND